MNSGLEAEHLQTLARSGLPYALIRLSRTQLEKSTCDATHLIREFLAAGGFHDYETQPIGARRAMPMGLISGDEIGTSMSVYRPASGKGDPRFWVYGLRQACNAGHLLALIDSGSGLLAINLTRSPLPPSLRHRPNLSKPAKRDGPDIVEEIVERLRSANVDGMSSAGAGSSMVGHALEAALGLRSNSKQAPDFHGIELKAYRISSKLASRRSNLLAKTPDWDLSHYKSSREMLDAFGYVRDGVLKLNCEVRAGLPNSQGLYLRVSEDLLEERSTRDEPAVVSWRLSKLETELANKHRETVWVGAETTWVNGKEHFKFASVRHTKDPRVDLLPDLLASGSVSLDHLMKAKGRGAHERGPLFKIDTAAIPQLFPVVRSLRL